jgi:hypothetical protein
VTCASLGRSQFVGINHVDVAKWQTHQLEGLAGATPWGFKSPHRHQNAFPQFTALSGGDYANANVSIADKRTY